MVDQTTSLAHNKSPAEARINSKFILVALLIISFSLIAISFVGVVVVNPYSGNPYTGDPAAATPTSLAKLILRFDVVAEGNIPSWFSGAILLLAAGLLALIAIDKLRQRERFRYHWVALAVLFTLFSLDEVAYLHEGVSNFMSERSIGPLQIGWLIPGALFVILVGLWYVPFVWQLPTPTRRLVITAGAIFLTGALGLEFAESLFLDNLDFQDPLVVVSNHLQDLFEMVGAAVFIYALLNYISRNMYPLSLLVC